ncbi:hypothetical protein HYR99_35480 [Candidatus Poribacteria bacterium]|nr:hypothetical protein [Candidatus Poribacteria bacterium]
MIQEASRHPIGGFSDLGANFDWGMGSALWKLEMRKRGLAQILQPLQVPLNAQEKAVRLRADEAYLQGWCDEALKDYEASIEKNYQDFAAYMSIGNIYLYHQVNLDKALESFLKAGKYAEPKSAYYASYAYLHIAFVCYLQEKDKDACKYAQKSVQLTPEIPQVHYHYAKFSALTSNAQVAMEHLENATSADSGYCFKVNGDKDFDGVREYINRFCESLHQQAKQKATKVVESIDSILRDWNYESDTARQSKPELEQMQAQARSLYQRDTYFDYLDVLPLLKPAQDMIDEVQKHEPLYQEAKLKATEAIASIEKLLEDYVFLTEGARKAEAKIEQILQEAKGVERHQTYSDYLRVPSFLEESQKAICHYPELKTLTGHSKSVQPVAFSADGRYLASGSADNTIKIYEVGSFRELKTLTGHSEAVFSVAFSADGRYLASDSLYKTIKIYERGVISRQGLSQEAINTAQAELKKVESESEHQFAQDKYELAKQKLQQSQEQFSQGTGAGYQKAEELAGEIPSLVQEILRTKALNQSAKVAINKATQALRGVEPESEHRFASEKFHLAQEKLPRAQALFEQGTIESYQEAEKAAKEVQTLVQEIAQAKKAQQESWESQKKCRECGEPLGFFDKLSGQTAGKKHR